MGSFCHLTDLQLLCSDAKFILGAVFFVNHIQNMIWKKISLSYEPTVCLKDPAPKSFAPVPFPSRSKIIFKGL